MSTIINRGLSFFKNLKLISGLGLYERRRHYFPHGYGSAISQYIYSQLCQIKIIKDGWVYDKSACISFDPNTDIGRKIYYTGKFEEPEINFLKTSVLSERKNPVILDIGANIGIHSIAFAKSTKGATVHSFEPSPHTREILAFNVKDSKLGEYIIIHPYALSDHSGKALFYHTDDDAYSSLKDTQRKKITKTVEVELTTIDKFVSDTGLTKIDLIKVDVEGLDNEVVLGGLETFKEFKPELFIEIYKGSNSNPDPELTIKTLINAGFNAYVLENGFPKRFKQHSDRHYNYFFTMNALSES